MAFFMCSKCGCIESTTCSNYWADVHYLDQPPLCSACDPSIGQWHGRFERRLAEDVPVGPDSLLQSPAASTKTVPSAQP